MITLYSADITGNPGNCSYPHRHDVVDADSLKAAVCHDYVCAEYKSSYRSNDNFISSDCVPVEFDNDHSDDPKDWVKPELIHEALPDVPMAVHYSRNHMKVKKGRTARPKFHVYFLIEETQDMDYYEKLRETANATSPKGGGKNKCMKGGVICHPSDTGYGCRA